MESLEDITGGRITRSLRKRLASVDSDSNSRPSTPQLAKLTTIPETSSPSRSLRGTRRNSITGTGTPSKGVGRPRKSIICEENDGERTPAKRNTRRGSVCVTDTYTPKKLQIDNSIPKANGVDEKSEINEKEIAGEGTVKLPSSPPLAFEVEKTPRPATNKKNKPGPKSRRSKHSSESDSHVEVINLEGKDINTNNTSQKSEGNLLKTPIRSSPRLQAKNFSPKDKDISIETIDLSKDTLECDNNKNAEKHVKFNKQSIRKDENENTNLDSTKSNVSVNMSTKETNEFENHTTSVFPSADESESIKTPEKGNSPKSSSKTLIESVVMIQKISPGVIAKFCGGVAVINSPNSKSVTFNDIDADDNVIKNSYPKTPASIKCRSYLTKDLSKDNEDKSFQSDKESVSSFKDASADLEEITEHSVLGNQSKESSEFHDVTNGNVEESSFQEIEEGRKHCTPHKQNLLNKLQSSTPMIDSVSPSKLVSSNKQDEIADISSEKSPLQSPQKLHDSMLLKKDKPDENIFDANGNKSITEVDPVNTKHEEKEELFSKSWTHTVSGNAISNGKIDTIAVLTLDGKKDEEIADQSKISDEQNTPSTLENKKGEEENEEHDETFQKLEFVDDEAIEVDDNYESGDSMDDEERKEMLENEIMDEGESIGSEDTLSYNINENDDEENASFITSDSEDSVVDYSDANEHLEDDSQNTTKATKKIRISSSSGSDANKEKNTNTISKKKKRLSKSKSRNRILSTSDSDVEEPSGTRMTTINNAKSNSKSEPLNFEVSRMIDESTDDEVVTNETSEKINFEKSKHHNVQYVIGCNVITNQEITTNDAKITESNKSVVESYNNLDELNNSNFDDIDEGANNNSHNSNKLNWSTDIHEIDNTTKTASKYTNRECSIICHELSTSKKLLSEQKLNASTTENEVLFNNEPDSDGTENKQNKIEKNNTSKNSNNSELESNAEEYSEEEDMEIPETQKVDKQILKAEKYSEEEDMEIPETQDVHKQILKADSSKESNPEGTVKDFSDESNDPKVITSGLSVSFGPVQQKRTYVENDKERKHHSSFTISVSVMKPRNSFPVVTTNTENASKTNSSSTDGESVDEFENLNLTNRTISSTFRKRKSMVSLNVGDISEFPYCKKSKRNSLQSMQIEDFNPSKSLIETIEDRKHEINKEINNKKPLKTLQNDRIEFNDSGDLDTNTKETNENSLQSTASKESSYSQLLTEDVHHKIKIKAQITTDKLRLSKSFCEPIRTGATTSLDSSASDLSNIEVENKTKISGSTPQNLKAIKNKKKDYSHIVDRCDEILDAANRAKLESKQNCKKSSILRVKSKKKSKLSSESEEEWITNKKYMKHSQEKTSQALEQAFKASAKIIMKEASKNKIEKLLPQLNEEQYAEKRLPVQLLEFLSNSESQDEVQLHNKESGAPLVHRMSCASGEIVEEILSPPRKKRTILNKFELPTGTVLEEPVTPKKKMKTGGFRESPITPRTIGFKVKHILSAGQDKVPESLASNRLKRKCNSSDPQRVLPKPQWSQSGVFLEEPLQPIHENKKRKLQGTSICGVGASFATVNAMNFKNSTIFRKNVPREASHEILKRKERQYIRKFF